MFKARIEKFLIDVTLIDKTLGDSVDISESVKSVGIKKNFLAYSFPLFLIEFRLTQNIRDRIRDNNVLFNLRIDKYEAVDNEQTEETETPTITGNVLETLIKPYNKIKTSSNMTSEDDEDESQQTNTLNLISYGIMGVPEELVSKNYTGVNQVYENSKLDSIVVNIISEVESGKIFIDPTDNTNRERTLLVPPLNPVTAIKYLQEVYGIYNSMMGLFFDTNGTYIFKHFNKDRDFSNYLEVVIPSANQIDNDDIFTYVQIDDDEDENAKMYLKNSPEIVSVEDTMADSIGGTTVFNSYDENFNLVKRIHEDPDNQKVRYFWNDKRYKIFEDTQMNLSKITETTSINLMNIDPNYFNIDTLYRIESVVESATGEYSLLESNIVFSSNDRLHYTSSVSLNLAKY